MTAVKRKRPRFWRLQLLEKELKACEFITFKSRQCQLLINFADSIFFNIMGIHALFWLSSQCIKKEVKESVRKYQVCTNANLKRRPLDNSNFMKKLPCYLRTCNVVFNMVFDNQCTLRMHEQYPKPYLYTNLSLCQWINPIILSMYIVLSFVNAILSWLIPRTASVFSSQNVCWSWLIPMTVYVCFSISVSGAYL